MLLLSANVETCNKIGHKFR